MTEWLSQLIKGAEQMTMETYDDLKQYVGSKNDFTDDLLNQGYTKGYAKGKTDAIQELKDKSVFYSNKPIEELVLEARNNAIDECLHLIEDTPWRDIWMLIDTIKELKGQK